MESPELPECPVCLQNFDAVSTIPRVLACGHSACEACLRQLPKPFQHTVRCPACTQLVKYPHPQGPSALPKNIDLLRFSSLLQNPDSQSLLKPTKINEESTSNSNSNPASERHFLCDLWSNEFYLKWKDWILPSDAVLDESDGGGIDGFCSVSYRKIVSSEVLDSLKLPVRCFLKGNQEVSVVRISSNSYESDDSKFSYSYISEVMRILYGMNDDERGELTLITRMSLKYRRLCKVYGLWYNTNDRFMYIVSENFTGRFLKNLGDMKDGSVCEDDDNMDLGINDYKNMFVMIGFEICEAISVMHSEGVIAGCLSLSCFNFDEFGHVYVDLIEVLVAGRRVRSMVANAIDKELLLRIENEILRTCTYVTPEIFFELLHKEGVNLGYGSDSWSLACVMLQLLIGKPFSEEMRSYYSFLIGSTRDEKGCDYMGLYMGWKEKVVILLETRLGTDSEFIMLKDILCKCLNFDANIRPNVVELWKFFRGLIVKPHLNKMVSLEEAVSTENVSHCVALGELCKILKEVNKGEEISGLDGSKMKDVNNEEVSLAGESKVEKYLVESISGGRIKYIRLKAHLDCITGLAVGGGYLFSSSFDRTVHVWSLQDYSLVHSFKGHEHRIMAVVFVDKEEPLCISGDSGGAICIWSISFPFDQLPVRKLQEEKDWRYSGIHALAASGAGYLYTGSGDKLIKVWSLEDYTLSCTMSGHKSVVSALAICDAVLYSGSWDGTVRLWCLNDHSPLAVLGEDTVGNITSVLSLAVDQNALIVAHENGCIKMWSNDVFIKSKQVQKGSIFSVVMEGKWLFTGGWDRTVDVQELSRDASCVDAIPIGSIACESVITALLYCQGKLFIGQSDRNIKVYCSGV